MLTEFGLCYTIRENVKIRKMQILFIWCIFWPSYATFSMRRFLLTAVYITKIHQFKKRNRKIQSLAEQVYWTQLKT